MKKFLIFLVLPLQLFSQTDIDQIRSDSDVVNFIRTMGPRYVDSIQRPYLRPVTFDIFGRSRIYSDLDSVDRQFADSIMATRWIVDDITGDGQKDLVFYGKMGNSAGVFVFFFGPGNERNLVTLTDMFADGYPHSIELYKKGNEKLLILGSIEHYYWTDKKSMRQRYFRDTLVYKFGYFPDYNDAPKPGHAFDSIEYRFSTGWTVNHWYMKIYKNGTALYVRERDSVDRENRRVVVFLEKLTKPTDAREWQALLDYIKFETLNDKYELKDVSDQATGLITVYFSNGTKKMISDYGERGTFGLQTLYQHFFNMAESRDWKLMRKTEGLLSNNPQF